MTNGDPQTTVGIFLGYELVYGCYWRGGDVVAPMADFGGVTLHSRSRSAARLVSAVTVPTIRLHPGDVFLPCKEDYDKLRGTLDGVRQAQRQLYVEAMTEPGPFDPGYQPHVNAPPQQQQQQHQSDTTTPNVEVQATRRDGDADGTASGRTDSIPGGARSAEARPTSRTSPSPPRTRNGSHAPGGVINPGR